MKKIDAGQAIQVLANLGVIASILFLGVQVRSSSIQARVATTLQMAGQIAAWRELIVSNGDIADVYTQGIADFGQLSAADQARFDQLMRTLLNVTDAAIAARDAGLIEVLDADIERRGLEGELIRHAKQPGFSQWWSSADHQGLPPTIVMLMDQLVTQFAQ